MKIEDRVTGLPEARAAFERGRNVIVVAPPAVEHAGAVWELMADTAEATPAALIICADTASAIDWADSALAGGRVHPVTGLARTQRLLESNPPSIIAGTAKDLAAIVSRSALKLGTLRTVVIAWLEGMAPDEHHRLLDPLLADAAEARRIVLTWDPTRLTEFLERHAYRAPMVGHPEVDADGRPAPPAGAARYAIVPRDRRARAARAASDALGAVRPFVWRREVDALPDDADVMICVELPAREEFAALTRLGPLVLLLSPTQLPYARSLAAPLKPLVLPSEADLARDRAEDLRSQLTTILERGEFDAELALLAPLLDRFDPAEVAAALLALSQRPAAVTPPPTVSPTARGPEPEVSRAPWTKIFVGVGKKERASAKDLVGALIREAGLSKEEIGRVEVRETFSLVELAPGSVERALRGLGEGKVTIRGRRVTARRDRDR